MMRVKMLLQNAANLSVFSLTCCLIELWLICAVNCLQDFTLRESKVLVRVSSWSKWRRIDWIWCRCPFWSNEMSYC
jgi:hypothetical protein